MIRCLLLGTLDLSNKRKPSLRNYDNTQSLRLDSFPKTNTIPHGNRVQVTGTLHVDGVVPILSVETLVTTY